MKITVLSVIVALALTEAALSSEYREFSNQEGKTIHARIVEYDAEGERVQLEIKNRKKAWIQLSDLSEMDQTYIRNLNNTEAKATKPEDASNPTVESLSRNEIKAIAEQYAEAVKERNMDILSTIFFNSNWKGKFIQKTNAGRVSKISIGRIEGNNISITSDEYAANYIEAGWLQLTPSGKIKYCPFFAPHPIESATSYLLRIANGINNPPYEGWIKCIQREGVPTFGLHPDMSHSEMREPIEQIRDWILENGAEYDNSEPQLFLPEKQMKVLKQALKSGL